MTAALNFLNKTPCWPTACNPQNYLRKQTNKKKKTTKRILSNAMHLNAGALIAAAREEVCLKSQRPHHPIPIMTPSLLLWHLGRWKAEIQITLTRADLFIFSLISVHNLSAQMFTGLIKTWKKKPKSINLTWNFKHSCISCLSSVLKELPFVGGLKHGCHWAQVKRPALGKDHPPCWWNS